MTGDAPELLVFLQRRDLQNLKLLVAADGALQPSPLGTIPFSELKQMVTAGDYKKLPPEFEEVLSHLPETGPDRAAAFDQAYYRYGWRIFGKKSGLLRDYWRARMDLLNLLIFLRLRKRGASFGELSRFLVEPGFINHHEWLSRFEESQPELGSLLEYTPYRELLPGGEKNLTELSALERAIDDYLLSIAKAAKMVPLGIEPIIGYLLAKEREILNLRLVFTGKLNKLRKRRSEGGYGMSTFKMAVIGEEDLIRGFGLLGLELFPVVSGQEARDLLFELKDDRNYGVIFITESIAQGFTGEIEEWGSRPLPCITYIPGVAGSEGYAAERIRRIVEKAVGVDILKGKEVGKK